MARGSCQGAGFTFLAPTKRLLQNTTGQAVRGIIWMKATVRTPNIRGRSHFEFSTQYSSKLDLQPLALARIHKGIFQVANWRPHRSSKALPQIIKLLLVVEEE